MRGSADALATRVASDEAHGSNSCGCFEYEAAYNARGSNQDPETKMARVVAAFSPLEEGGPASSEP